MSTVSPYCPLPRRAWWQSCPASRWEVLAGLWMPSSTLSAETGYILGGLLLGVALLLFILHKKQSHRPETYFTPLENPAFIQTTLDQSIQQRRKFAVVCTRKNLSEHTLNGQLCPPEDRMHLTLELTAPQSPQEWIGAPVDVYFHLEENAHKTFFHFSTFAESVDATSRGWLMTLIRPSMLTNNQRREFVRITPGAGMVEAVTAWALPQTTLLTLPRIPKELGRPPFAYRPPRVVLLELMDIAAGGVRLRLPVEQVRATQTRCAPGTRFVLLLSVDALRHEGGRQLVWLCAIVRRAVILPEKSHIDLGLQFTHWCTVNTLIDPIEWQPVELDGEVPFLLRWVARAHVLLSRLTD